MSKSQSTSAAADKGAVKREIQEQRFTPLRSCVTQARALAEDASGELALTPIIPAPRLQS